MLGLEVAGSVTATGEDVTWPVIGDAVTALVNGGGYAEFCVAPARQCLKVPSNLTPVQAAGLPENLFTVWANVFADRAHNGAALSPGETLLVHGGTSGIGLTAIQLALARGSRVIATAGSERKCAACRQQGAEAINYREQDFADAVASLTGQRGVDVVLDMVGAPYLARNLRSLAEGGRLSMIAFLGGSKAENVDLMPVMTRRLTITGATMRRRGGGEKAMLRDALAREVWPLLEAGTIVPVIEATFPLDRAADAHRLMEAGTHIGKIILTVP